MTAHTCPSARHPSPHWLCYANDACRCTGCRQAHVRQRHLRKMGEVRLLDAATTRARLRWLRDQGATDTWLAETSGVSRRSITRLRTEASRRARRDTVVAIARLYDAVIRDRVRIPDPRTSTYHRVVEPRRHAS